MASKRLRVMTAAVAGLAMLSVAGLAAAAAGLAPASAEGAAPRSSRAPADQVAHEQGSAATAALANRPASATTRGNPASGTAGDHATGPDASGPARHGLCQAWSAGQGDVNGRRMDATAFEALVAAAGGADQVAAFCQADAKSKPEARDAAPPDKDTQDPTGPSGPPDRTDRGQGQGGPPTSAG
jgi:hypothetical protein